MEQHFQDMAQKVIYDRNFYNFAAHFTKHFTQKPTPQQSRKSIVGFGNVTKNILQWYEG